MHLPADAAPTALAWAGHLASWPLVVLAARGADWGSLRRPGVTHLWPGACVLVLVLWQIRAEVAGLPAVHLLGATLLTLVVGWRSAVVGLVVVAVADRLFRGGDWPALGLDLMVGVIVPVVVSEGVRRLTIRSLPRQPFAWILLSGFAGGGLAAAAACLTQVAVAALGGLAPVGPVLVGGALLVFPEAFVTGALVAWMVAFYPHLLGGLGVRPL
ncbi:MAG: energy-coupling factor ABC transporter permease [Ectothiorhodospiraceae bacterium]|nr:energy-coupling factor ABC transporter permease [Chromatiales bacterium]MCP5155429.1 energy-coupling factor ABC transporter permease [Ectothiorhodospiraceae bacterium]